MSDHLPAPPYRKNSLTDVPEFTPKEHAAKALRSMNSARNFPENTCPASRHTAMIAEALAKHGEYHMIQSEPESVAASLADTVAALWKARDMLQRLGYEARLECKGRRVVWRKAGDND